MSGTWQCCIAFDIIVLLFSTWGQVTRSDLKLVKEALINSYTTKIPSSVTLAGSGAHQETRPASQETSDSDNEAGHSAQHSVPISMLALAYASNVSSQSGGVNRSHGGEIFSEMSLSHAIARGSRDGEAGTGKPSAVAVRWSSL